LLIAVAIRSESVVAPVAVNDAVTGDVIVALSFNDSLTVNPRAPAPNVVAVILLDVIVVAPVVLL